MKKLLVTVFSACAAAAALGADAPAAAAAACTKPTTVEINQCMQAEQERLDGQLKATYERVLAGTPETTGLFERKFHPRERLEEAQAQWLKSRDADCTAVYELWVEGTVRTIKSMACFQDRTALRIRQLEAFAARP